MTWRIVCRNTQMAKEISKKIMFALHDSGNKQARIWNDIRNGMYDISIGPNKWDINFVVYGRVDPLVFKILNKDINMWFGNRKIVEIIRI